MHNITFIYFIYKKVYNQKSFSNSKCNSGISSYYNSSKLSNPISSGSSKEYSKESVYSYFSSMLFSVDHVNSWNSFLPKLLVSSSPSKSVLWECFLMYYYYSSVVFEMK